MDPIPEKVDLAWILKNRERIRDALRTVGQTTKLDYILPGGEVRRAQYAKKAGNAVLDLRTITSGISQYQNPANPPVSMAATGGTESQDGEYRVHIFYVSGELTVTNGGIAEILVLGGGGGGGAGGGGGGRWLKLNAQAMTAGVFTVTIGAGGVGGNGVHFDADSRGNNGGDTSIGVFKAVGGGGGGSYMGGGTTGANGRDGGSGGGGGTTIAGSGSGGNQTDGSGTFGGVGFNGGSNPGGFNWMAGGGGAGGVGANGAPTGAGGGGAGGAGLSDDITGTLHYYAGGGGGFGEPGGLGGSGVGGTGATYGGQNSTAAAANTGAGGGGGAAPGGAGTNKGSDGGSGIVVVRYLGGVVPPLTDQIGNDTFPQPGTPGVTPGSPTSCETCLAQLVVADDSIVCADDEVVTSEG